MKTLCEFKFGMSCIYKYYVHTSIHKHRHIDRIALDA